MTWHNINLVQLAGAVEIQQLLLCRRMSYLGQSDGEVPVMLELWGMRSTPSLPSLPGPLWKVPIWGLNRTKLYTYVRFEGFEGQGLRTRLCCRRYLTPYFGHIILPHVDWPAQCLAQRKSQKKYTKRKDRKKDKRRKYFFYTFLYLLGEGTNQRYVPRSNVVPKTPDSKMV